MITVLLLTAAGTAAIAAGEPKLTADARTLREVTAMYDRWIAAFDRRDLDDLMATYHPKVQFVMQGQPDQDFKDLEAAFKIDFTRTPPDATWRPQIESVYAQGSLVAVVAIWEFLAKDAAGNTAVVMRIRSVDVLTRDGKGLRILHTVNYPLDPPSN
jgi:ketosteroid isomerase-like protein